MIDSIDIKHLWGGETVTPPWCRHSPIHEGGLYKVSSDLPRMERGEFRYDRYAVLLQLLTYDLRSVSGMRSIVESSTGVAKPNAKPQRTSLVLKCGV